MYLESFRLVSPCTCWEGRAPNSTGRDSCTQDCSGPCPMYLFICLLYYIRYNKLVSISVSLSSLSCSSKLGIFRKECGDPWFIGCWWEVQVTAWDLRLASQAGAVLWDWALNLGVCTNSRQSVSELSWIAAPPRVRQELENLLVWKNPHIWCQKCCEISGRNRVFPLTSHIFSPSFSFCFVLFFVFLNLRDTFFLKID